jgi:Uma2 family endonuclease
MALPQEDRTYTYEDWLALDEDIRAELIGGELYMMTEVTETHQTISMELCRQLSNFLMGKPCKVFHTPFDVRLSESEDTVLEPDILVVCDRSKLDGKTCNGAPDLVVEILSPSTARLDRVVKFELYRCGGVREYWIVEPDTRMVFVAILENGYYRCIYYADTDTLPVSVLPGCEIDLGAVFAEA